jgi:hypothetical protein
VSPVSIRSLVNPQALALVWATGLITLLAIAQPVPARRTSEGAARPRLHVGLVFVEQSSVGQVNEQPGFFEPTQDYYQARGSKVTAAWGLDRIELPENGELTASLTIRGATNPHEIVRPDLAKVRDDDGRHPFAERFQIEDVSGKVAQPEAKEVVFVYRLRPRGPGVNRLPSLPFWYDTGIRVGNPFQLTRAKGIDIVVARVAKARPPAVPLIEPDRLFQLEAGPPLLDREPFAPGIGSWALLFGMGLVIAGGWYAGWRWVYPEGVRLARLRRSRAARRAADAIGRAGRGADPAGTIAAVVIGYLRARFPLPPGAETPTEIGDGLRAAGLAAPQVDWVEAFLRRCDEFRFAPISDKPLSLAAEAESLLVRLEAVE